MFSSNPRDTCGVHPGAGGEGVGLAPRDPVQPGYERRVRGFPRGGSGCGRRHSRRSFPLPSPLPRSNMETFPSENKVFFFFIGIIFLAQLSVRLGVGEARGSESDTYVPLWDKELIPGTESGIE
jgi:hypothetical protein